MSGAESFSEGLVLATASWATVQCWWLQGALHSVPGPGQDGFRLQAQGEWAGGQVSWCELVLAGGGGQGSGQGGGRRQHCADSAAGSFVYHTQCILVCSAWVDEAPPNFPDYQTATGVFDDSTPYLLEASVDIKSPWVTSILLVFTNGVGISVFLLNVSFFTAVHHDH